MAPLSVRMHIYSAASVTLDSMCDRRTQLASFSRELQMSEFKSALVNVTLSQQPTQRAPLVHTSARYSFPYLYLVDSLK